LIQNNILDPLALEILEKKIYSGDKVEATLEKGKIVFIKKKRKIK